MSETASHRHLLILSPPGGKPLQFELKGKRVGLGRSADNHICVDFKQISGSHLEFELVGDDYVLKDLNSTNGVTVNGDVVTDPVTVKDGDRLTVGRTIPAHYLVVAAGEKATAAATFSGLEEQKQAAAFTSIDEKIQKLEGEAHELEEQIASLKSEYEKTKIEHDKALEGMKSAEERLREKENKGADDAELDALQSDLLEQTRRFKVLASDLDGQKQQLDKLQRSPQPARAAQPLRPSQPETPLKPSFASPAPVSNLPVAAPSPATSPPVQIAAAAAPAIPQLAQPAPPEPAQAAAPVAAEPAQAAPVAVAQPAQTSAEGTPLSLPARTVPAGATPQVPAGGPRAKLQMSGDTTAPPKPTMKLASDGQAAAKRPGLNVPKKPAGEGPKTVKLG